MKNTGKLKRKSERELTPRQLQAIENYTDPQSPSFGNKTRSVLAAGFTSNVDSARALASRLFAKDTVKSELERLMERKRVGMNDRIGTLSEILHRPDTDITHLDAEGKVLRTMRMSNDKSRIQAVRELNKMSGVYQSAAQRVGISNRAHERVLQPMIDYYAKQMRQALTAEARNESKPEIPPSKVGEDRTQESDSMGISDDCKERPGRAPALPQAGYGQL